MSQKRDLLGQSFPGERTLRGHRWDGHRDIDFKGRFIEVQRGISRGKIDVPKSGKSRRVDMSRQLTESLKTHKRSSREKALRWVSVGCPGSSSPTRRARCSTRTTGGAGLRRIRIHDLRYTYVTLRISKGDNIADISNQLGDHSVKLTMDVYFQWIPGKQKPEVDGLEYPSFQHPSAPYPHPDPSETKKGLAGNQLTP